MTKAIVLRILIAAVLTAVFFVSVVPAFAQTETATVSGRVTDPDGGVVRDVQIQLVNRETNVAATAKTNGEGLYVIPNVHPGIYSLRVTKSGFKEIVKTGLVLHVQDSTEENFSLQVGSVSESVTVTADPLNINTADASVSTVVDERFVENMPLNGRSFQSLIQLTPGVVLTANNGPDQGQFSVNGQRATANYWTVDGVSANIGLSANGFIGSGIAGALGSTNAFGGTNGLVSVDALQEFRIQTSTYAPEFGRQPGGQISIVTRSGTNQFHGSLFDYLRNDKLDANDWFGDYAGLSKPKERQNDFGGTLGGPIWKNKTFFFFSYEGLRLRLPVTALTLVPDTSPQDPFSRQFAQAGLKPYLNTYPLPNGPEVLDAKGNHQGIAQFNSSYSTPSSMDAYSLRMDHKFADKLNVFGRYNQSPSEIVVRGATSAALSTFAPTQINIQTATLGAVWAISPSKVNDFRFNYSAVDGTSAFRSDDFGGATPLTSLPFPGSFTTQNGAFRFVVNSLVGPGGNFASSVLGASTSNRQRQLNMVDSMTMQIRSHSVKFGLDYRRLRPTVAAGPSDSPKYGNLALFFDMASADTGTGAIQAPQLTLPVTLLFHNLGMFAQDTWRVIPRLTVTYGLRWDVDFVAATVNSPQFNAISGFDLNNLSNLALLPAGTKPYETSWGSFAPRLGVAYRLSNSDRWQKVLRGGVGMFYDLASSQSGNLYNPVNYPFGGNTILFGNFSGTSLAPAPPIVPPNSSNGQTLYSVDPKLQQPYTLQWNLALEQSVGKTQSITASYLGASGRRLLQTAKVISPNPSFSSAGLITNVGSSDYNALQLQYRSHLSRGLQGLASYTWSHSFDTASTGSLGSSSDLNGGGYGTSGVAGSISAADRGPSSFDVRHAVSAGITYDLPSLKDNTFFTTVVSGWSLENIVQARSATPVDVYYSIFSQLSNGFFDAVRPDVVAGQPFYLSGPQFPGGKAFNAAAFTSPPLTPTGCVPGVNSPCNPVRQGNLPRNALRGFGEVQWDLAVHRDFSLFESLKLQFRAEMFNVINHPNFGPPANNLNSPAAVSSGFGVATQTLGRTLAGGNLGGGAFNPLYQVGGPRSIQLALRLVF
jgi:hypothetical protein